VNTKNKLLDFSNKLEKIGHIWVFVEIVKTILEFTEKFTGIAPITTIHSVLELVVLIFTEIMSIILVHLIFKFASLILEGIAVSIE